MLRNSLIFLALVSFAAVLVGGMMDGVSNKSSGTSEHSQIRNGAVMAKADPGARSESTGERSVVVNAGPNGHHRVEATINDTQRLSLMVDTGASLLYLTRADAERLGIDVDRLNYAGVMGTANGNARFAPITLDRVEIGDIRVDEVDAAVVESDLPISLLGMSFLNRLSSFEVSDGQLIMRN